jgi:DHA2 family multidrug resistance protein
VSSSAAARARAGEVNRPMIVLSIMTATIMISLDTTIANVALPHIQGSVSASLDQITWVLTSYIVASAIMTPLTGWLTARLGRKRLFLVAIGGFTFASALCGIAGSLVEIVGFRLFQGICGAPLIPLAQSVLLDIYPREKHGQAMAIWGMGAMLGPIMGPALGGWLTDNFSWRWVFYINLPFGALAMAGAFLFIHGNKHDNAPKLDWLGFLSLTLGIGALQMMLDRGETQDWFAAPEIWIELGLAILGFYLTTVQTLTGEAPFIRRRMMKDRNFLTASVFGFFIGILIFATMALLPPMIETILGYPVVTTGLVTAPRGFGTLLSMFVVGRLIGKVDTRLILFTGLGITAYSLWLMTHFDVVMGSTPIVVSGLLQGAGMGLIFVPLSTIAFSTLDPALRTEAAGVYTLIRNIGSSVGISIMQALLSQNTSRMHASLVEHVRPDNPNLQASTSPLYANLANPANLAAINGMIGKSSAMVAYLDSFKLMMIISIAAMPLLLLMRPPKRAPAGEAHMAVE